MQNLRLRRRPHQSVSHGLPYKLSLTVFIQRNFIADFLQAKCDFGWKTGHLAFLAPPSLGAYGQRTVFILGLVLIELFFARCYGWGATSEYRFKIFDFAPTGAGWPKISGRRGRPHQPFFFSQKTRLKDLSCGVKIWTDLPFCHNACVWQTDRRTDSQT